MQQPATGWATPPSTQRPPRASQGRPAPRCWLWRGGRRHCLAGQQEPRAAICRCTCCAACRRSAACPRCRPSPAAACLQPSCSALPMAAAGRPWRLQRQQAVLLLLSCCWGAAPAPYLSAAQLAAAQGRQPAMACSAAVGCHAIKARQRLPAPARWLQLLPLHQTTAACWRCCKQAQVPSSSAALCWSRRAGAAGWMWLARCWLRGCAPAAWKLSSCFWLPWSAKMEACWRPCCTKVSVGWHFFSLGSRLATKVGADFQLLQWKDDPLASCHPTPPPTGLDPNCPGHSQLAERLLHAALQPGREPLLRRLLGMAQDERPTPASCDAVCCAPCALNMAALAQRLQANPLLHAIRHSSLEALRCLLAAGCLPGAVPPGTGPPPLVAAAARLDSACCRVLLDAGAPAGETDRRGQSALDVVLALCTDAQLVSGGCRQSPACAVACR